MRLDQELVKRGLCESRTEAQELISKGAVTSNGIVVTKRAKNIEEDDILELAERRKYVSRGGEKLEGALLQVFGTEEEIRNALLGLSALDVGSSTGGFTDCLLRYGVVHVDAVDVGSGQLHSSLKKDARVSVHENTDIRTFASEAKYGIVVADLSFIALEQALDAIVSHAAPGAFFFLLIKPQFEVGKGNTKKGIVKDSQLVADVLDSYRKLALQKGIERVVTFPCVLRGGDGNQEYFLFGKNGVR